MGFWSRLTGLLGGKTRLFVLDVDSDALIAKKCQFNPFHVHPHYKKQVTTALKFLMENNLDEDFTIPEIAVWKLTFYAGLLEQVGDAEQFKRATLGLKNIYQENELSLRDEIKFSEALKYLT